MEIEITDGEENEAPEEIEAEILEQALDSSVAIAEIEADAEVAVAQIEANNNQALAKIQADAEVEMVQNNEELKSWLNELETKIQATLSLMEAKISALEILAREVAESNQTHSAVEQMEPPPNLPSESPEDQQDQGIVETEKEIILKAVGRKPKKEDWV